VGPRRERKKNALAAVLGFADPGRSRVRPDSSASSLISRWRPFERDDRERLRLVPSDVDQVVLAITLDREDVPVGILEPGDSAAASAG